MGEEQLGAGLGIIIGLVILAIIGAIVGWIASIVVRGTGLGLTKDILLGIAGSIVGGWLFQQLGLTIPGGVIGGLVPPVLGAILILVIVKLVRKA